MAVSLTRCPSMLGSRRDATISWGECIGLAYIWNRTLLDAEFDTLNASPFIFITAPGGLAGRRSGRCDY